MKAADLTNRARRPHKACMRTAGTALMAMLGCGLAGGCISVKAPDKPIEIELNINIKQEVIYRLAPDVEKNIEANPEIF
jgi:hypothetical protein